MLDLGVSVELLFGESVLNFCSDWLNVEMFYRVIDLAFSQIKETNNFMLYPEEKTLGTPTVKQ